MYFHPRNRYHWDFWMIQRDRLVHSFYLSRPRPGAEDDPDALDWLGHATSADLFDWQEQAPAIPPGPAGAVDDMKLWTGHIFEHDGQYYLYYTGRARAEQGRVQRTMLATSPDLYEWTKHPEPVMAPDPRWYHSQERPDREGNVGWRDPVVVLDEETGWFHAYLAAYEREGEYARRGCVAHARSRDLIHWETLPPVFTPRRYATIEVPDVFRLDGRWYLTLLTGAAYGNERDSMPDPRAAMGTIYAVSDSLDGPFTEPDDNLLIGSKWWEATSCRSVMFDGVRYLFHFSSERLDGTDGGRATWGVLAAPKRLEAADGRLTARYVPVPEQHLGAPITETVRAVVEDGSELFGEGAWAVDGDRVSADVNSGWAAAIGTTESGDVVLTATVRIGTARSAGIVLHAANSTSALCVLLDAGAQQVTFTRLRQFDELQARGATIERDRDHVLRIVAKHPFYEVYLDDVLMISCVRYEHPTGRMGLLVEQGSAEFADLSVRGLLA
jgi:beta-fructofuranosidase